MEAIEEDLVEGYRGVDARELRKFSKVDSILRNLTNLVSRGFEILFLKCSTTQFKQVHKLINTHSRIRGQIFNSRPMFCTRKEQTISILED